MNIILKFSALGAILLAAAACGSARVSTAPEASSDEDVINIGYGTVTGKNKTVAANKVKINKNEIVAYSNMYDYLRGRVPGVEVTNNNQIVIRGVSTNSGQTDPLILVDGVEVTDLSYIDPINVEDVTVLKDASASIYGVRGGNGVILITMKR